MRSKVNFDLFGCATAGEQHQLLADAAGHLYGVFGMSKRFPHIHIIPHLQASQGNVQSDATEQVIEVMCQAAGDITYRLQPLGPQHFGLKL